MKGSKLPYHLRVNKCVDRQLFLEALGYVARFQSIDTMGYISMGGGYLEDFRVMHQAFNIVKMLSFDLEEWMISRQMKNRPYGFVSCTRASSTEIVDEFHDVRRKLMAADANVIVWLDYTEADQRYSQLSDLQELTSKLIEGDVFRITMNAHRPAFGRPEEYELERANNKTKATNVHEWWNEKLVEQVQEYMPQERNSDKFIREELDFAITLVSAARIAAMTGLQPRQERLTIEPLMSVVYADGQQMITVSGIVLRKSDRPRFMETTRWNDWQFKPGEFWTDMVRLKVPHMSIAERHSVHENMANPGPIALDFKLDGDTDEHDHLINQYVLHHRRYPTFGSINVM